MENPNIQSLSNQPWLSEAFRLTIFYHNLGSTDMATWWQHVTGDPPENRTQQIKALALNDQGPYDGGHLVLTVQPSRADLVFFPSFNKAMGLPEYASLAPFSAKLGIFQSLCERFFQVCPDFSRIAFGLLLNIPVATRAAGYSKLAGYLHNVNIDPDASTDFLYQINRPRPSKAIQGFQINRLSKWVTAIVNVDKFLIGQSALDIPQGVPLGTYTFARTEIDINTVPASDMNISREHYSKLFLELVELAIEIGEKGDTK